jgi:hypothetical protein
LLMLIPVKIINTSDGELRTIFVFYSYSLASKFVTMFW